MKMLLLGADGQVGFALQSALSALGVVTATTRKGVDSGGFACLQADLSNFDSLRELILAERPDWIVNAAAYTAVDRAEAEPDVAKRINAQAVSVVADAARSIDARVIHYSTDYVFPGDGRRPWAEDNRTSPLGAYGHSKLAGEWALRDSGAAHLILRTAWVYGPRGNNFLRTMLRLAGERERLSVVADQFGTPTTAVLVGQVTAQLIVTLRQASSDDLRFGTYHLTAAGHTSWYEFANEIFDLAHAAKLIARRPEVSAITSAEFKTPAQRPAWSVLDTRKLQSTFDLFLPHWRQGLQSTLSAIADERTRWPKQS